LRPQVHFGFALALRQRVSKEPALTPLKRQVRPRTRIQAVPLASEPYDRLLIAQGRTPEKGQFLSGHAVAPGA
jgi:hypothetical protein